MTQEEKSNNSQRYNTEIFDQKHQMYAEGSCDDEPTISEVISFVKLIGWDARCVDISFDGIQNVWRWTCDIKPLKNNQQPKKTTNPNK